MVELEHQEDGVAVLTIDRPEARNAIGLDTMGLIEDALDKAAGAHVLVITGGGDKAFVSGGDLKELATLRTQEQAEQMARRMRGICDRIAEFPGPVIAALNGHAYGGGAEFALAADIRVAADDIRIGFNQVKLAIMPAWGGAERLAALIGPGKALLLAGSGRLLDAAAAERAGLVDLVLPRAEFADGWRELARSLAHAPATSVKQAVTGLLTPEAAVQEFARLWVSDAHWEAAANALPRRSAPRSEA